MARKREDLTGQKFGELTVQSFHGPNPSRWDCECSCGAIVTVRANNLKSGRSKSCGHGKGGSSRLERGLLRLKTFPGILVFVARDRGPSTAHSCVECGSQAKQWMSDGTCPELRRTEEGKNIYSWCQHPHHYVPVCHRCSGKYVEKRGWWEDPVNDQNIEKMPKVIHRTVPTNWDKMVECSVEDLIQ